MTGARSGESLEGGQRVGEVVEAASHRFLAQCYRLYCSPPLGAFVRTQSVRTSLSPPLTMGGKRESKEGLKPIPPMSTPSCAASVPSPLTRAVPSLHGVKMKTEMRTSIAATLSLNASCAHVLRPS